MLIELADVRRWASPSAGIGERRLHEPLAVVEGALDGHRRDVVAERRELHFLHRG